MRIQRQVTFATRTRFFPFKWHSPGTILSRDIFRYIRRVSQNCIASFARQKKKKKETRIKSPYQSTNRRVSSTMEGPKFYNRNVSQLWSAALMSLRAATCHGGVLCPRLAFLQAQCGRCALDVTFFLPLSSFMLHRLNIQLDPKRRKLPAKQSHVYLTIVILSLVDRGKKRNVHIYFSTRIHGSGITFSLVTMQGNVASSVSI